MITQTINDPIPDNAVKVVNRGNETTIYFADDAEVIADVLRELKADKQSLLLESYKADKQSLTVGKQEYNNLLAATLAGITHKDKNIAETKSAFKDAVLAMQAITYKRDDLLSQINNATTIEEVKAITWRNR